MNMIIGSVEPHFTSAEQMPNGTLRMVLSFPMLFDKKNGLFPVPQNFQIPPEYGFRGGRGRQDASGTWNWEVTLEGGPVISPTGAVPGQVVDEIAQYSFEPADLEVPITSHPDILKLMKIYGATIEGNHVLFPANKLTDTKNTSEAVQQVKTSKASPMFGVEAYLSFQGTWTKSYTIKKGGGVGDIFTEVEKIVPTVPMPSWINLTFGKGREWLKRMPILRFAGTSLQITERYLLSGIGGHNPAVYTGNQSWS